MTDNLSLSGKETTTFAVISSTEEIHFFGELASEYTKAFMKAKQDMSFSVTNPALEFLARKNFHGYSMDSFQKTEFINLI